MKNTFIAGITAIALTASTATPTQAAGLDEEQIGQLLFGLVAVATVAKMIENQDRQRKAVTAPKAAPKPKAKPHNNGRTDRGVRMGARKQLPAACLTQVRTRHGAQSLFQRSCMRQNYAFVQQLPRHCGVRVRGRNGPTRGWDPQCLRDEGYRTNRRHR